MKTEFYKDKRGEWRWRVVAKNGRILAISSESYKRKHNAVIAYNKVVSGCDKVS